MKSPGLARSLLFIFKTGLKSAIYSNTLFSSERESMGTRLKMRPAEKVGGTGAPISILKCQEEATSYSHGADCYTHCLHRITMDPSGYLFLRPPANHFRLITFAGPSVRTSQPPFPSAVGEKRPGERKSRPLSVCTGCLSGVRW